MGHSADHDLLPLLRAALEQTQSAACITTAELDPPGPRIVYVNPAYCRITGRTADEVIGDTPRLMQGPLTDRSVLDRLRADLEAGRSFAGEAINYRADGEPFLISWSIDPVVGPDGTTTHYVAAQEDITRLRRAEALLAAEQVVDGALSEVLSGPGDIEDNLDALVGETARAVGHLVGFGRVTVSGSIRLGTSSVEFRVGSLDDSELYRIETTRLGDGPDDEGWLDDRRWLWRSLAMERSGIEGRLVVGDLSEAEAAFVDRDGLDRVVATARRALESLAEYERQRHLAVELQRWLLPIRPPAVPGLELSIRYQPGAFATRIGGDWYDVIEDGDRTVIVVGDMAGSGVRAAADMGRVRALGHTLFHQGATAPEAFAVLNRFCSAEDLVATAVAVTVDRGRGRASVLSAGHLPPALRRGTTVELVDVASSPLLGIGGDPDFESIEIDLTDGVLVLFTDGLVESPDEAIDCSLDRLVADLAADDGPLEGMADRLVDRRMADDRGTDDIAVVALRIGPG